MTRSPPCSGGGGGGVSTRQSAESWYGGETALCDAVTEELGVAGMGHRPVPKPSAWTAPRGALTRATVKRSEHVDPGSPALTDGPRERKVLLIGKVVRGEGQAGSVWGPPALSCHFSVSLKLPEIPNLWIVTLKARPGRERADELVVGGAMKASSGCQGPSTPPGPPPPGAAPACGPGAVGTGRGRPAGSSLWGARRQVGWGAAHTHTRQGLPRTAGTQEGTPAPAWVSAGLPRCGGSLGGPARLGPSANGSGLHPRGQEPRPSDRDLGSRPRSTCRAEPSAREEVTAVPQPRLSPLPDLKTCFSRLSRQAGG